MTTRSGAPGEHDGEVWVVGSINVDLVVAVQRLPGPGQTVLGGGVERHPGGKGANQAVAAARDGALVHLVGAVGADPEGRGAVEQLAAEGIDTAGIQRLADEPTGLAIVVVDDAAENLIVVAPGANGCLGAEHVRAALGAGGVCLVSLEVPDAAVVAAAERAVELGLRLVLNPAPARPLADAVLRARPILTPNAGEARTLAGLGDDADPAHAAARLAVRTGAPVVVTLGAEGCLVVGGSVVERIPAPSVAAVDTTGAGDAFSGVLASSLARGLDLAEAARRAVTAGALATTRRGARAGMAGRSVIDAAAVPSPRAGP